MRNRLNIEGILQFVEERKLSKKKFSELCGFSLSVLNKILSGQTNFRINALPKLARGMNVRICDLFVE